MLAWQPKWKSHMMKQIFCRTLVVQTLRGNKKQFDLAGNWSCQIRVNQVKATEKWDQVQRKCGGVPVIQV